MEILLYLAAFLLIKRLQKSLSFSPVYAKWKSVLSFSQWATIIAYVATLSFLKGPGHIIFGSLLLAAIVFLAEREADFKVMHSFIRSHYPLIAAGLLAGLVKLIAPDFYNKWDNYFDFAIIAAFVWTFARWATTKKSQEEFRIVSQKNLELDKLVAERTVELTKQKNELQETLLLLQTTQNQLIQSEKLASLGELTAGIAHEIQNPLNFVNNFSEVSIELIDEMEQELFKGDKEEAVAIASDIKQNLEKIIHHGKRADGIVKGMLQHSRASNGVKELTDINLLADEYLRLAYHGLRAKDKSFNAEMVTNFDPNLLKINIVQQDIGRALLNLFNNAFYAVNQKQKTIGRDDYKPEIKVITSAENGQVIIKVIDNGTGIPDVIKEKIMQPFFTTKPTGEGTGLGLSLTYDMIVKGHGGSIAVNSTEGSGSEFIISLPLV